MKKLQLTFFYRFLPLLIVLSSVVLKSCTFHNDDFADIDNRRLQLEILAFDSFEEFKQSAEAFAYSGLEEIIANEEARGFKSFGRLSDEIYRKALSLDFQTEGQLIEFVEKNSQFVEIVDQGDGEKSFQRKLQGNSYRYLINSDRMFVVGNDVFKIFEHQMVVCPLNEMEALRVLKEEDIESLPLGTQSNLNGRVLDVAYNIGSQLVYKEANGKERVVVEMDTKVNQYYIYVFAQPKFFDVGATILVKGQRKTIFNIWYDDPRTLSCNIKAAVDYAFGSSPWGRGILLFTASNYGPADYWSQTQWVITQFNSTTNPSTHFSALEAWARTPGATLSQQQNTFLLY